MSHCLRNFSFIYKHLHFLIEEIGLYPLLISLLDALFIYKSFFKKHFSMKYILYVLTICIEKTAFYLVCLLPYRRFKHE